MSWVSPRWIIDDLTVHRPPRLGGDAVGPEVSVETSSVWHLFWVDGSWHLGPKPRRAVTGPWSSPLADSTARVIRWPLCAELSVTRDYELFVDDDRDHVCVAVHDESH